MAVHSITLELPDNLYKKFQERSQQTNRSIEDELLAAFAMELPVLPLTEASQLSAYNEILEFLTGGPSPEEITKFQLSDESQRRAQSLLVKERDEGVTVTEARELDYYVDLGDFLGILRAKAMLHLHGDSEE